MFAVVQSAGDMHHWGLWDIIRACCDEGFEHFVGQPLIDKYRDGDFVGMVCGKSHWGTRLCGDWESPKLANWV